MTMENDEGLLELHLTPAGSEALSEQIAKILPPSYVVGLIEEDAHSTNHAGGMYNDAQAQNSRPEHDPKRFYGPYIIQDTFDGWDCQQNIAVLESDRAGCILAVWHVCPCGCRGNRRLPVNGHKTEEGAGWAYSVDDENRLTMSPSVQDRGTCGSHYFIRNGMVEFCPT